MPVVKALTFPTYRRSDAQGVIRDTFSYASQLWIDLHDPKKQLWRDFENYKNLVGRVSFMNYFLNRYYKGLWQFEVPPDIGFCLTGNHLVNEFAVGGGLMSQS